MKLVVVLGMAIFLCTIPQRGELQKTLTSGWARAFSLEKNNESRLARYCGFIEGHFDIEVPGIWTEKGGFLSDGQIEVAFEITTIEGEQLRIIRSDPEPTIVYKGQSSNWTVELSDVMQRVLSGPWVLYAEAVTTEDKILVFGKCGRSVRFLRVLSRNTGETLGHIAFFLDSKENVGEK